MTTRINNITVNKILHKLTKYATNIDSKKLRMENIKMSYKKKARVDQKLMDKAKLLVDLSKSTNLTKQDICKTLNIATGTLHNIEKANFSIEQHKQNLKEIYEESNQTSKEQRFTNTENKPENQETATDKYIAYDVLVQIIRDTNRMVTEIHNLLIK